MYLKFGRCTKYIGLEYPFFRLGGFTHEKSLLKKYNILKNNHRYVALLINILCTVNTLQFSRKTKKKEYINIIDS